MISLPGFTVSPAEEVKSRNFAFKVYHTGTTFYFAAESGEDLAGWVDSFSKVTVSEEEQSKREIRFKILPFIVRYFFMLYIIILDVVMSETDGEEEEGPTVAKKDKTGHEHGPHKAAMKKLSDLISGHLTNAQDSAKGYISYLLDFLHVSKI